MMSKKMGTKNSLRQYLPLMVVIAVAALAIILFLIFKSSGPTSSTIPSTNPVGALQNSGSSNSKSNSQTNSSPVSGGSGSQTPSNGQSRAATTPLQAPFGDFVSNHSPSLSSSTLSQEYSVCDTTPGATCHIEFTKDGVIRKLAPETTDSNGAAYWRWNVNDAGLTAGNWTITVFATLGRQSQSTPDGMALSVKP